MILEVFIPRLMFLISMNTLAELLSKADFTLRPVPFCAGGLFFIIFNGFIFRSLFAFDHFFKDRLEQWPDEPFCSGMREMVVINIEKCVVLNEA